MRTRLTGFIALVALLFSGLFVVANAAGAQDQEPEAEPQEEQEETVLVCKSNGLDWTLWEMSPEDAAYWLDNGAQPGDNGCLVRVCQLKAGDYFEFWTTAYLPPADADWVVSNYNAYKADPGVPCKGNKDVSICVNVDGTYQVLNMDPQSADWLLYTGEGHLPRPASATIPNPSRRLSPPLSPPPSRPLRKSPRKSRKKSPRKRKSPKRSLKRSPRKSRRKRLSPGQGRR